ncbi:MAG: hypothetical protein EA427_14510 [Spirochaetaceae bacterium]|nr:MAG: hypothetical protein EA427_14510 [Spirochaetaceae bacterium]
MKTNRYIRVVKVILLGMLVLAFASGQATERRSVNGGEDQERILPVEDYGESWITGDSNGDGRIDYALKLDDRGQKRYEAVDHNKDGRMDNFYYYRNGVLHRQEIDTNYDGKIDLWIYMYDGVRVRAYERDTNHDGTPDLIRRFGES